MLTTIGSIWICLCLVSFVIVFVDIINHRQMMKVMNFVYPINTLWGGPIILWVYFTIGKHRMMKMDDMPMDNKSTMPNMGSMKMDHLFSIQYSHMQVDMVVY